MILKPFEAADSDDYERFLYTLDESLIYYGLRYKAFLEDLLECRSDYWLAIDENNIVGALPIMVKDGPWGRVINSLPYYGSNGGVLARSDDARKILYGKYSQMASDPAVVSANLIDNPVAPNAGRFISASFGDERISQVTMLQPDGDPEEFMMGRIDGTARRNVRKAEKSGVTVRIDNAMMDFVQEVHTENMAEIGGNAKSPAFFAAILRHLRAGQDFDVFVADHGGVPVSALLVLYHHKTVEYFTPVTRQDARNLQPMALVLLRAMIAAIARGYTRWNWGGTWLSQEGVWRFKHKWAAQDSRYRYYTQINDMSILDRSPQDLLDAYPGFYLVPFDKLNGHDDA
ncbi:MAG: GNAT family N-acetyltransferase [Alphaproteobacteria bacterium]|nr:GNAT family N-acetyltransferase [Alphaproteobacteria bacterium]